MTNRIATITITPSGTLDILASKLAVGASLAGRNFSLVGPAGSPAIADQVIAKTVGTPAMGIKDKYVCVFAALQSGNSYTCTVTSVDSAGTLLDTPAVFAINVPATVTLDTVVAADIVVSIS